MTRPDAHFGSSLSLSSDTLAVGSFGETGTGTGINGPEDGSATRAGAVYVFSRTGTSWAQQAYIKASNTRAGAEFGSSVALSGETLAVGSSGESSSAKGVGGPQGDSTMARAGAVYVFTRSDSMWSQQAYLKASNTRTSAEFGTVALSGNTLAVGAFGEFSAATGVDPDQSDTSAPLAGAVYVFSRRGSAWSQSAYIKASNTRSVARFGKALALSGDTLAVGSEAESSVATGINGNQADTSAGGAGAVYLFARRGAAWSQQAYVKASNTNPQAVPSFGSSVAVWADTLAVAAPYEPGGASGINGNMADAGAPMSGAVYLFR